ncbi:hypothetical protein [Motilimonas sp. KMU-193]
MQTKKRNLRNRHLWFSVWNPKQQDLPHACDGQIKPIRNSGR